MAGKEIGEFVRRERLARGLSLRALAERAGISHSYLDDLEKGNVPSPGSAQLTKLARALGVRIEVLLAGGAEEREADVDPNMEEIQVNLLALGELDPDALASLRDIILAMKEKAERNAKEMRRATGPRRGVAGQAGHTD